jgi:hypothetical protein
MNEVQIPLKITGISAIKAELRDIKSEMLTVADVDPTRFQELVQRAGELRDRLADVNSQVQQAGAGSQFAQMQTGIQGVQNSLMTLDFTDATTQINTLTGSFTAIAAKPEIIKTGLTSMMVALTALTGAVWASTKAVLMSPWFYIPAIIAAVVAVIVIVLNKFGLLKDMIKAVTDFLKPLIQGFKDFTDWLGLTDNKLEESAKKQKELSEKNIKRIDASVKAQEELHNITKDMTDDEIRMMEEKLGVEIDTSKSVYDIRKEAEQQKLADIDKEIALIQQQKNKSDEEKARLKELQEARKVHVNNIISLEQQKVQAQIKLNASLDQQIANLSAKQIKNEKERAKAMLAIQEKEALAKINAMEREAQQLGDTEALSKIQKLRALTIQDFERQRQEIEKKGNDASIKATADTNKVKTQSSESAEAKELARLKKVTEENVMKAQLEKKTDEEVRAVRIAGLEAEFAYLKKHTAKIIKDKQDQKNALLKYENDIQKERDTNFEARQKQADEERIAALMIAELEAQDDIAKLEASKALAQAESEIAVRALEVGSEERLLIEAETAQKIKDIDKEITAKRIEEIQKRLAATQVEAETKLSKEQFDLARTKMNVEQQKLATETILDLQLEALNAQQAAELAATDLTEQQKESIKEKYRQAEIVAKEEQTKRLNEIEAKQVADGLNYATMGLQATQQLTDLFFSFKKRKYEQGTKEAEKAARQEFAIQKAMNLGMAVIDGAKAITSILAQYPKFDGGFAMAAALTSAGIASAVNIAKIASAQFQGGGTAPVSPQIPTGGFEAPGVAGAVPNVSLFGQANQLNNVGAPGQVGGNQNITVTAVVSETEMTDVQNRVNKIQKNAEL